MALIECKECGHKVSDKAECCPNCGCPIEEIMSADASNDTNVSQVYDDAVQFDDIPPKKSKGWLWTIVVILVLAAIGVGVWLFTNGKLGEDDPTTAKVEITPEFIAAVHQYDELYPFSEGLAAVKKDGKKQQQEHALLRFQESSLSLFSFGRHKNAPCPDGQRA